MQTVGAESESHDPAHASPLVAMVKIEVSLDSYAIGSLMPVFPALSAAPLKATNFPNSKELVGAGESVTLVGVAKVVVVVIGLLVPQPAMQPAIIRRTLTCTHETNLPMHPPRP